VTLTKTLGKLIVTMDNTIKESDGYNQFMT